MGPRQRLELTWYNKDKALIPTEVGKYGYEWVSPSDPRYCETRPLVMDEYVEGSQSPKREGETYGERADLTPTTDNLLVLGESGDVLEALTRVPELAAKYVGQVKLIYIDPPFNTEQTFTHYEDNLEHSIWLTMMRDRLLHMKRLLRPDGSIWVHLDDAEVHRMRSLLDEVLGSENFIAELVWQKVFSPKNSAKHFSVDQDYLLVYAKESTSWTPIPLPRTAKMDAAYSNPDGDPRGPWTSGDLVATKPYKSGLYAVTTPSGRTIEGPPPGRYWRVSKENLDRLDSEGRVWWGPQRDGVPRLKRFLTEVRDRVPQTLLLHGEVGHNQEAKNELKELFPRAASPFATPKPERLLERVIHIGSQAGDIVLDVFAGSGTTAAVAQKMGRRWVTCELLESTFDEFTQPRLSKVVQDQDPGGITRTSGERLAAPGVELPEGTNPEEAAVFTSFLNKLVAEDPKLKNKPIIKELKAKAKTARTKSVVNWRGGGGFQVAHLAPACFDLDPELGRVVLTDAAEEETLVNSVAANLGFTLLHTDDDFVFDGRRGRTLLKVYAGLLSVEQADEWLSRLEEGEKLVIAATGVLDGVREHLRRRGHGSKVVHIPDDLFPFSPEEIA